MNRVIVITGASSGIGKALADRFQHQGDAVYGISRNYPQTEYHHKHLLCDVSNEEAVRKTVGEIVAKEGRIDVLINCAGMGISGAVEFASIEDVRKIFEVNVFGMFLFTREAIPWLRKSDRPKIVNIGSVAGELMIPFQTFYSMTKASVHAFSECLRMELKPFHIDVATVMPGDTKTGFTAARVKSPALGEDLYKDRIEKSVKRMENDEQNGKPPLTVVKVVERIIRKKSMPVAVTVGFEYKLFVFLQRLLPKRFVNWVLYLMYGK